MGIEIKDTSPWKDIVDFALDDRYNNSGGGAGGGSSSGGGGDGGGGSSGGGGETRPPTPEERNQSYNQAARPVTYSYNVSRSSLRGDILQKGSQGPKVALLQQTLESLGYLTMPTGVSYGYFGDLTFDAVNWYKNAQGLGNDGPYYGIVGAQTWETLNFPVDNYTFMSNKYDLGKGWRAIKQRGVDKQRHVHVYGPNDEHWSQNEDGSVHDAHKNFPGEPTRRVKKELKRKADWDWDENARKYREAQEADNLKSIPFMPILPINSGGFTVPGYFAPRFVFP